MQTLGWENFHCLPFN